MTEPPPKKIKVCLIHNQISPYRLPVFDELGKSVDLFVLFCQSKSKDRFWNPLLEEYTFNYLVLKNFNFGPFIINYSLLFILLRTKFDVYIVGDNFENVFSTFLCCFLSKLKKKPFILWSEAIDTHFLIMRCNERRKKKYIQIIYDSVCVFYRRPLYQLVNRFIAYSHKAKQYLIHNGVQPQKISSGGQVIPNSLVKLSDISKLSTNTKNKKIVLFIGYLRFEKGVDVLIKAFKNLDRKDANLIIGGSGPELKQLKELSNNTNNIQFLGYIDEEDKFFNYSIADIFVLPTFHDPWGLTVNEAMFFGMPIIITKAAGCIDYLIDGNGIIIDPGDVYGLQIALSRLLDHDDIRQKMGGRSKEIISQFDLKTAVKPFTDAISFVT